MRRDRRTSAYDIRTAAQYIYAGDRTAEHEESAGWIGIKETTAENKKQNTWQLHFLSDGRWLPPLQAASNKLVSVAGFNLPSDIASGGLQRCTEEYVMRCMTCTSQQECQRHSWICFKGKLGEHRQCPQNILAVGISYDKITKKHVCKIEELRPKSEEA